MNHSTWCVYSDNPPGMARNFRNYEDRYVEVKELLGQIFKFWCVDPSLLSNCLTSAKVTFTRQVAHPNSYSRSLLIVAIETPTYLALSTITPAAFTPSLLLPSPFESTAQHVRR
jgi:hypothetical protein